MLDFNNIGKQKFPEIDAILQFSRRLVEIVNNGDRKERFSHSSDLDGCLLTGFYDED